MLGGKSTQQCQDEYAFEANGLRWLILCDAEAGQDVGLVLIENGEETFFN